MRATGFDTPLWDAIDTALDQFRQFSDESYKVIICLTDGIDTRSRIPIDYLIEKVQGNHIPIYTLSYGEGLPRYVLKAPPELKLLFLDFDNSHCVNIFVNARARRLPLELPRTPVGFLSRSHRLSRRPTW